MRYAFLIPARNAGAKLLRTLDSVLSQTSVLTGRDEVDCLILDGASNDDSLAPVEALRDPRVTILSEPDSGMYDALAKGLGRAGGDVTCYLPAGETYDPHAFSVVSEVFAEFPEIHWLTGQAVLRNAARQIVNTRLPHPYSRRFIDCGMYGTRLYGIEQESTFWRSNLNALVDLDRLRGCELAGDYFLWKSMARRCAAALRPRFAQVLQSDVPSSPYPDGLSPSARPAPHDRSVPADAPRAAPPVSRIAARAARRGVRPMWEGGAGGAIRGDRHRVRVSRVAPVRW
jgi:glycosyltransferase involved in cell wall biosynthesis